MSLTLGDRIRQARQQAGLSQIELAGLIHVSKNAMNRIEGGDISNPRACHIKDLADVLQVSTDYLLGRVETPSPCPAYQSQDGPA